MNIDWIVVGVFLLGIVVGTGTLWVKGNETLEYQYTCTCTNPGGAENWSSSPAGNTCPPPGFPSNHCP